MSAETVTRVSPTGSAHETGWWVDYHEAAGSSGLSETALRVLDLDTDYILHRGVFGAGRPDPETGGWPATRVRRGLVVGSVQSGKTASMLGLAAKALDSGVDVVVLLSGTRVALWRQTLDRTLEQLDRWSPSVGPERERARVLLPPPHLLHGASSSPGLDSLYHARPARVRRALERGQPLVAVVMKQADHLIRFGGHLRAALEATLRRRERPLHLLVVDDEADDGSILDAVVEAGLSPDSENLKQIPRHIVRLWAGRGAEQSTFDERVYASYVAYTATPQANFLQADHNPLSPRDFVVALRTPFDHGNLEPPREITYREPVGLRGYYTGGEVFYSQFSQGPDSLCHAIPYPERSDFESEEDFEQAVDEQRIEQLSDALRAYFVSSAMRLVKSQKSLSAAKDLPPTSLDEILALSPKPSSMLVHPSAAIEEQARTAHLIAMWAANLDTVTTPIEECPESTDGKPVLLAEGLRQRLEAEESMWRDWHTRFEGSRQRVGAAFPGHGFARSDPSEWEQVKTVLRQEVFEHVKLSMINSDPSADDRPAFRPQACGNGDFVASADLLTIFVSGNVMSRGVTLEGLTTTVFLRGARSPAADTQMQMQRWFGYRGAHLYWCRVFMYEDQLHLFRAYHENDVALRAAVLGEMNDESGAPPSPLVLQGRDFRATGKIANLRALPLCPGRQPFVRLIGLGSSGTVGCELLADLLDRPAWKPLRAGSVDRGLIWEGDLSLLEVAEVLEQFRYQDHDPDPFGRNHKRWLDLAHTLGLQEPERPLFRPPGIATTPDAVTPDGCPYSISAYLRLWSAALSRRAPGLFPTDDSLTPWSMISLGEYAASAPRFRVGVRFGGEGEARHPRLAAHGIHRMKRRHDDGTGRLEATWGSRNPGEGGDKYLGDHLFDYHETGLRPPTGTGVDGWRPRGHPGLLLFHVVRTSDEDESVTVGLGLPLGGPDHFAALPPRGITAR